MKREPVTADGAGSSTFARFSIDQSREDASEIGQIVRAALADCKVSADLRGRLGAVLDRADRIARNLTNSGEIERSPVTAETITDEQIREAYALAPDTIDVETFDLALGRNTRAIALDRGYTITPLDRWQARTVCAAAYNARLGGGS